MIEKPCVEIEKNCCSFRGFFPNWDFSLIISKERSSEAVMGGEVLRAVPCFLVNEPIKTRGQDLLVNLLLT